MSESLSSGVQAVADQTRTARRIVAVAALAGAASAAIGTTVSFLAGVGQTPGFLFGRSAYLSTLLRWNGLPFEFFGLVWFVGVLLAFRVAGRSAENGWWTAVFVSAIPVAGLSIWLATAGRGPSWMAVVAAIASLSVLLTAALVPQPGGAQLGRTVGALMKSPRTVIRGLGVLLFVVISAEALRSTIRATSSNEAQALSFRRWYAGQPRSPLPDLSTARAVKVVAFTDYKCPYCATALPAIEATISRIRLSTTTPVELVIRDYPLEAVCNPAITRIVHPGACLMAAAVRFVRQQKGDTASHEFASWCYQGLKTGVSDDAVWDRLRRLGLSEGLRRHLDAVMAEVRTDAVFGQSVGVRGTPAVFVNGIKVPGVPFLDDAVGFELARASSDSGK